MAICNCNGVDLLACLLADLPLWIAAGQKTLPVAVCMDDHYVVPGVTMDLG